MMKRLIQHIFPALIVVITVSGCNKYVSSTKSTTSGSSGSNTGPTPLGGGGSSSGSGSNGSSGGSGSTNDTTVDAVYMQGFYLPNMSKQIKAKNDSSGETRYLLANAGYTKMYSNAWGFYTPIDPPSYSTESYMGKSKFTKNGYYSIIQNYTSPQVIILDNGNNSNPSTSKSYVRFINLCDSTDSVSVNVKLSNGVDEPVYYSYRKPFDFYASAGVGVWTAVYNQYFTDNSLFKTISPGFYNGEMYISSKGVYDASFTPTYNFAGGKKYTIVLRQKPNTKPNFYYYDILQHN